VSVEAIESILWDDWHVLADLADLAERRSLRTALFDIPLTLSMAAGTGDVSARRSDDGSPVRLAQRYGFVWACLGQPRQGIIDFPDCEDPARVVISGGSIGVAVSGLRAVENFLDLGHLAFVHEGTLGQQPHTAVTPYRVAPRPDGGIIASGCRVYQPQASPVASDGFDVGYTYQVARPYTVFLTKSNPLLPSETDLIILLVQPVSTERCVAHMLLSYVAQGVDCPAVRRFQQLIFSQDKPILENQRPKRLPLDPGAEIGIRADAASTAYRRWLRQTGVRFGAQV
jgi:phenylpropionate dioxygenase-like ring-hydroxylating dioxygenase large terminal subunit